MAGFPEGGIATSLCPRGATGKDLKDQGFPLSAFSTVP